MQALTKHLKLFGCNKRGISTVIVVMLSLVLIVVITSNVILWSYQMNQLDMERMQEALTVTNATRATNTLWFTARDEFIINQGTRISGTYIDTQSYSSGHETFREETTSTNQAFHPSGYVLVGATQHLSGTTDDLILDEASYMTFRSYPTAVSANTLYLHQEQTIVGGIACYSLQPNVADAAGTTLSADAQNTGRAYLGSYVYPLVGIQSIPSNIWAIYYRAQKTTSSITAHCDVNILIRTSSGAIRSTIATDTANSAELSTSWSTLSGTYSWAGYTVVDQTDYLEIDFYIHVTAKKNNEYVRLRIDDNLLASNDQTRIAGVMLPSEHTLQVELTGSSNTQDWTSLKWTLNSAFTTSNVDTTLQLYNYIADQYSENGDGYIAYNSNSIPNTDETLTVTIITNPSSFRDPAGAWKIRITGIKHSISPFVLKLDFVELESATTGIYRLDITNTYKIDIQACPIDYIQSIEILLSYNVSTGDEKWFLKAYNWTDATFSNNGFNNTEGNQPVSNRWNEYTISVPNNLAKDYITENGTILIELIDEGERTNQAVVDLDFFAVRAIIDGISLDLKNPSPLGIRIVAIWLTNSTTHQRYNAGFFINSGERATYIRADIKLLEDLLLIKVATERGNLAVFSND